MQKPDFQCQAHGRPFDQGEVTALPVPEARTPGSGLGLIYLASPVPSAKEGESAVYTASR